MLLYVVAARNINIDPCIAFRSLGYLVAIWKGYRAQHPRARKLPAILPIVVHRSTTGWAASVAFEVVLDADAEQLAALGAHAPLYRFLLDDLSEQTDANLCARLQMNPGGTRRSTRRSSSPDP